MSSPLTSEVGGAIASFWHGGAGPSHAQLTSAFTAAGYGDDDPYDQAAGVPNKEQRVNAVVRAAIRRPDNARALVDRLLEKLRLAGAFDEETSDADAVARINHLRRGLRKAGWTLTADGYIEAVGEIDLTTGGREALDEHMDRIRRSTDDPGVLLGSAKDLLEATAKFVLQRLDIEVTSSAKFPWLLFTARDRLQLNPQDVPMSAPGANHIRKILQSAAAIADSVNELRALQGLGHGRTLPTGVSPEVAWMVIREACSVAELMLTTLDRKYGRDH